VRDEGGLPTADGRRIRDGALVRSDVIGRLTPAGRQALLGYGIRTIIDVRSVHEVELDWHVYPFRDEPQVAYRNLPFATGRDGESDAAMRAAYARAKTRSELNRIDINAYGSGIAAIVGAVADAPEGGVLIHCHAGKDRTGIVVAMLLALAGVGDDDIADDYALSALNLEPLILEWLDSMTSDAAERARLRDLSEPRREAMLESLAHVRGEHGSVEDYLVGHGLTAGQAVRIRTRFVEFVAGDG